MMDEYDLYVPSMYGVGFDYYLGSMGEYSVSFGLGMRILDDSRLYQLRENYKPDL